MLIPTKKLKSGFEMPVYGLGTWEMGGRNSHDPDNNDEENINSIKLAIDSGVTHIDTAEAYADGYAEELIGRAIKNYDRKKLFIASKVWTTHFHAGDLINAAKNSLKRLNTSYLDLYYLHRFAGDLLKESMIALNKLVNEGLIKNIGVSNFNIEEFEEAQSYSKVKIVANQLHLNLKYREAEEKGLVKFCETNDVMFVAWRPLQKGLIVQDNTILDEMAKKYNKTKTQIAINWLVSQKNVVTISKTSSLNHLKENLAALDWKMSEKDIKRLDKEFPNQEKISNAVPLH